VELLVVIAIIALLMALLLPAVQSVRESARVTQCTNNLRQLATGCQSVVQQLGRLPAVGGHYKLSGDANLGYGKEQPGGWLYNLLPFVEQLGLHDLGVGLTGTPLMDAGKQRAESAVGTYLCPTRGGGSIPYLLSSRYSFTNIARPAHVWRSDYVGCSGSAVFNHTISNPYNSPNTTGVFAKVVVGGVQTDGMLSASIKDGLSATFLAGEKYKNPDFYNAHDTTGSNDQGWSVGYDTDSQGWSAAVVGGSPSPLWAPSRDTPGYAHPNIFGSPHGLLPMAMCDGSTRLMAFDVDLEVFRRLGDRADGQVTVLD
jgi:type II secretory pathway pseudopilin PulG